MLYQKNFQEGDLWEKTHLSCHPYFSTVDMPCPLHCHSYYEIAYLFKGERVQEVDGKWYKVSAHSLFLIPPLLIHGYVNITSTEDTVIQFTQNFLSHISPALAEGNVLELAMDTPYIEIKMEALEELRSLSIRRNEIRRADGAACRQELFLTDLRLNKLVMTVVMELLDRGYIQLRPREFDSQDCRRFDALINDILLHPDNIPDMEAAARMSGLSYYAFSRHFKASTGFNYSEYCNILKLRHAENLLVNTDLPVSDVAEAIGITTFSYFSRLFKNANGMSPRNYRKQFKDSPGTIMHKAK